MRVLLLNYEFPPIGGGAAVATKALAEGFARRGVMVDVVTSGPEGNRGTNVTRSEDGALTVHRVPARRRGIHEVGLPAVATYLARALPLLCRLMRRRSYDVVHCFFSLPTGALLPLLRLDDTPVIVSLRGSDVPGYDVSNRTLRVMHRALGPLNRWVWRRADRVVALSHGLGRLARRTMPDLEYDVIHNGVDTDRFHPAEHRPHRDGPVRCIAVARLIDRKGLDDLLRAWGRLERGRYHLTIVGDGPSGPRLRHLARHIGLADDVSFVGRLDRPATAERLRAADIFTLAPRNEAFGNAFAEALASGLPVIATRVGGIPEFVRADVHGSLVRPGDAEALAAAIEHLGESPERRARLAANARAHAEASLSWTAATRAYLDVYERVARARSSPPVYATALLRGS